MSVSFFNQNLKYFKITSTIEIDIKKVDNVKIITQSVEKILSYDFGDIL